MQRLAETFGQSEPLYGARPYLRMQLAKTTTPNSYEGYWLTKALLTINGPGPEVDAPRLAFALAYAVNVR